MAFEAYAAVRRNPTFRDLANSLKFNESDLRDRVIAEADGSATWARRAPNAEPVGDLSLQVDVDLAVSNALALT